LDSEDNAGDMSVEDFQEALLLDADLENGQRIFNERCASCHRANGEGFALGPDLISVKTSGKNRILDSILFPNREVQPQYVSYEVETSEGRRCRWFDC
jgi:putative heme-binding domain-containing protein